MAAQARAPPLPARPLGRPAKAAAFCAANANGNQSENRLFGLQFAARVERASALKPFGLRAGGVARKFAHFLCSGRSGAMWGESFEREASREANLHAPRSAEWNARARAANSTLWPARCKAVAPLAGSKVDRNRHNLLRVCQQNLLFFFFHLSSRSPARPLARPAARFRLSKGRLCCARHTKWHTKRACD